MYWTVGNPGPQIDRSVRGDLDNLFSDSVVALDPDTGQRKWHYQFTPNDGHDWDSAEDLILVDRVWRGQMRKLLLHADRNGYFYVLDRTNGKFLSGTPFVYTNWNAGFDENGRPQPIPGSNSSTGGSFFVYPTIGGGTNFQAPSYSPVTGWMYLEYSENGQQYVSTPAPYEAGRQYIGRTTASGDRGAAEARRARGVGRHQGTRSRNRKDDVGFQDFPGLADQWRARDCGQRAVRRDPRRQSRGDSMHGPENISGTSRRAPTWRHRRSATP